MAKYDWATLRREYVEGDFSGEAEKPFPALNAIAQRHGVAKAYLRRRAAREQWSVERERFAAKVQQMRREAKAAALSEAGARFDQRTLHAANLGMDIICDCLDRLDNVQDATKDQPLPSGIEIQRLMMALRINQQIVNVVLGKPDSGLDLRPIPGTWTIPIERVDAPAPDPDDAYAS